MYNNFYKILEYNIYKVQIINKHLFLVLIYTIWNINKTYYTIN